VLARLGHGTPPYGRRSSDSKCNKIDSLAFDCGLDGAARRNIVLLGVVLAAMNVTFYMAIGRLPLGTAAGMRTARNLPG
jgi:hypothetical protein